MKPTSIDYVPAGDVVSRFHASQAFVRGLMGPVGSSKSSACCMEIFSRACEQAPHDGVRHTRWAAVRSTYGELETTTLETWRQWFPMSRVVFGSPITATVEMPLADGTRLKLEVLFFPVGRPDEIEKLSSLELTGGWINEAREMPLAALNKLPERVGRFPPVKSGGPTWRGVIMDTNSPDDDSWWYRLAEKSDPKLMAQMTQIEAKLRSLGYLKGAQTLYEFFNQPGGLKLSTTGELEINPLAENIANLDGGYAYYYRQAAGKSKEWIKAQILGQYASVYEGRAVYPEWNDDLHCAEAKPNKERPLLLGFDYGLTPACVICQVSAKGQLLVLSELFAKDIGIRQFARDIVRPHLALNYHGFSFQAVGDPAGMQRAQTDEKTCFMELAEEGIACVPAASNNFIARREAVAKYLTRLVDGKPALIVDPGCDMIRRGFNGRYQYKRLQLVGDDRYRDVPDKNDFSHCFPAHTLISTQNGDRPISCIAEGDFVLTPFGPRRVTSTMSRETRELACVKFSDGEVWSTPDHPFITSNGVVFADCLRYNDVLIGVNTKEGREWADRQSTQSKNLTASNTTKNARAITKQISDYPDAFAICTEMFGNSITALFWMVLRFIIETTIKATTPFQISNWWMGQSTLLIMESGGLKKILPWPRPTWRYSDRWLPSGTSQKRAVHGTQNTGRELGMAGNPRNMSASNAASSMKHWPELVKKAIALLLVKALRAEHLAWTMNRESVKSVILLFRSINTRKQKPAPKVVGVSLWETQNAVRVYDLTVEEAHCFYANGVLVHNCHDALQYAAMYSTTMQQGTEWGKKITYPKVTGVV